MAQQRRHRSRRRRRGRFGGLYRFFAVIAVIGSFIAWGNTLGLREDLAPLDVGHGRGAAYGSAQVNLLRAAGYNVQAEYYINDAGN